MLRPLVRSALLLFGLACAASPLAAQHGAGGGVQLADQLDPHSIPQFVDPLVIPPAMPTSSTLTENGAPVDYYEIAVRQFDQQILPSGLFPQTTVWGYGSLAAPGTVAEGGSFNFPAFTIEAQANRPVRVKWINDLVDANGNYLPHLLPVDQTLHWANPNGALPDTHGHSQAQYTGPVPLVTHLHGAHTTQESDGYPEQWYLPAANNIPADINWLQGTFYDQFAGEFQAAHGVAWTPGSATYQYPNDQRATQLWYHDHAMGLTRLNVYAGPVGFYMIRGGASDVVTDATGAPAVLPGPAPQLGDAAGTQYAEIPLAIQDRSFTPGGQLYYPDNRAYFESLEVAQLQIPFKPDPACDGQPSDISGTWLPEFFGTTMVVNGKTWPYLDVEPRQYRFRILNGCQSRFLILSTDASVPMTLIGSEGGYLVDPVAMTELLVAPAERNDVIFDFSGYAPGTVITLVNTAPDAPFGGGIPGVDYLPADPMTTGQVMQFRVGAATAADDSTPAADLVLPTITPLPATNIVRQVTLNEEESANVFVSTDVAGNVVLDCANGVPFAPKAALLGTLDAATGLGVGQLWMDPITETPTAGQTEIWEIHNLTMDAHPIHIHQLMFEVVSRQPVGGVARGSELWEKGWKDTVIAYPGEITRVRLRFDYPGRFVWHCHILEHEDNEMMRPLDVLPNPNAGGGNGGGAGGGGQGAGGGAGNGGGDYDQPGTIIHIEDDGTINYEDIPDSDESEEPEHEEPESEEPEHEEPEHEDKNCSHS